MKNTLKVLLSFLMAVSVMLPNLSLLARAEEGEELTVEETMPTLNYYNDYPDGFAHEEEPNDTRNDSDSLKIDTVKVGEMGSYNRLLTWGNDVDWYNVYLTAGSTYEIGVLNYNKDYYKTSLNVGLYDNHNYSLVNFVGSSARNGKEYLTYTATYTGNYFIQISNYYDELNKHDHYYGVYVKNTNADDAKTGFVRNSDTKIGYEINGKSVANKWIQSLGSWYYIDKNYNVKSGWLKYGNSWYYFDNYSYAMITGWLWIDGEHYYFAEDEAHEGIMTTGWKKIDKNWYYFDSEGAKQVGWIKYNNAWYYLDIHGVMKTGWQKIDGSWYYLKSSGVMATGWLKYGNSWYYLKGNGIMATGWVKYGNSWYFMNSDGEMQTGWYTDSKGNTYYLDGEGEMVTGWKKISGYWYYFKSSGIMAKGWVKVGNTWYHLDDYSGELTTGWYKDSKGDTYYLKPAPSGAMVTGLRQIDGDYYYFKSSGIMACNENVTIDGNIYFIGSDGRWIADFD